MSLIKLDPVHSFRYLIIAVAFCGLMGVIIAYVAITLIFWDTDSEFGTPITLVQWIYIYQIQHIWHILHRLW